MIVSFQNLREADAMKDNFRWPRRPQVDSTWLLDRPNRLKCLNNNARRLSNLMQASIAFGLHNVLITLAAPQQFDASIYCIRLAQCFTDAKKQFFPQKNIKKSVKIGKLFITIMNRGIGKSQ